MKNKYYQKYTTYTRYVDFKKLNFIIQSIMDFLIEKTSKIRGLDVGCGEGNILIPLASLNFEMIGLDISLSTVKSARKKSTAYNFDVSFIVGDAETLMFSKENFDFIICSEVLEHLCKPKEVLTEIYKLLKRNGLLIVTVPNGYGPYSLIYDHFRNKIISKIFRIKPSEHKQAFTFSEITSIIFNSNFQILKVAHSDFISFLPLINKSKIVSHYDCKLADKLPHAIVSGWYIVAQKLG